MNKAVFLDRDGTINEDIEYLHKIEDCRFIPGALEAISLLAKTDYKIIIITGQSGIGRGYYTEKDYFALMEHMTAKIVEAGGRIDASYFCPHHPEKAIGKYKINCDCRKPKIGLVEQAKADFNLDLTKCWMIGDKTDDTKAGENAGCKTILVMTGKAGKDNHYEIKPNHIARNLFVAVKHIIENEQQRNN